MRILSKFEKIVFVTSHLVTTQTTVSDTYYISKGKKVVTFIQHVVKVCLAGEQYNKRLNFENPPTERRM